MLIIDTGGGSAQQQYAAHHRTHTTTELGFRVHLGGGYSHTFTHQREPLPVCQIHLFLRSTEVQSRSQWQQNNQVNAERRGVSLAHLRCHVYQLVDLQLSSHVGF